MPAPRQVRRRPAWAGRQRLPATVPDGVRGPGAACGQAAGCFSALLRRPAAGSQPRRPGAASRLRRVACGGLRCSLQARRQPGPLPPARLRRRRRCSASAELRQPRLRLSAWLPRSAACVSYCLARPRGPLPRSGLLLFRRISDCLSPLKVFRLEENTHVLHRGRLRPGFLLQRNESIVTGSTGAPSVALPPGLKTCRRNLCHCVQAGGHLAHHRVAAGGVGRNHRVFVHDEELRAVAVGVVAGPGHRNGAGRIDVVRRRVLQRTPGVVRDLPWPSPGWSRTAARRSSRRWSAGGS